MSNPKIGLVTVLYNGVEILEGFFESLSKQTFQNYILYIIDNSPNDIALKEAKRLSEVYSVPSEFVYNNANLGVAKGNNQGIELSLKNGCDYILLLNNDIEFDENTIEHMVRYAIEHNESIIVPKIYYYGTNKLWMAGGEILKMRGTTIHYGFKKEDDGLYDSIKYIGYAPTCFMLIKDDIFNLVGFMDEKYFVYYDDTDYVYRLLQKKINILYLPKVHIQHKVSFSTGGEESSFSLYYKTRNRVYFNLKNFSFFYKVSALAYLTLTRLIRIPSNTVANNKIIVKAILDGLKMYYQR